MLFRNAHTDPAFGVPDLMPVLSRGRHRNAKRGACFMEFASHLAGERWSDHPRCTHPAVARLARLVNDWSSDTERSRLAPMIPAAIGIVADDPVASQRIDLTVALLSASAALPIASEERQRPIAVTIIRCSERLASLDPEGGEKILADAKVALSSAPLSERWARQQLASTPYRAAASGPIACDAMTVLALAGIGEACTTDVDGVMRTLLAAVLDECHRILAPREDSRVPQLV